ncbi:MAG: hypothetical protein WAT81_02720 [Candidatus Moraniibacteriota bacterium]
MEQNSQEAVMKSGSMTRIKAPEDAAINSAGSLYGDASMVPMNNMAYDRIWYADLFGSKIGLVIVFGAIACILAFNAFYLKKKQGDTANINRSIIWVNAIVAVLVVLVAVMLYLTFRPAVGSVEWNNMMIST